MRCGRSPRRIRGRLLPLRDSCDRGHLGDRHDGRRRPRSARRSWDVRAHVSWPLDHSRAPSVFGHLQPYHPARAGLAAQAAAFLQQAGYVELLTSNVWDTSWLLSDGSVVGRLAHTLIGYTDRPSGAQLVVYSLTMAILVRLIRFRQLRHCAAPCAKCSSGAIAFDQGLGILQPSPARATATN